MKRREIDYQIAMQVRTYLLMTRLGRERQRELAGFSSQVGPSMLFLTNRGVFGPIIAYNRNLFHLLEDEHTRNGLLKVSYLMKPHAYIHKQEIIRFNESAKERADRFWKEVEQGMQKSP